MSRLRPFRCPCHYHVLKLMRDSSAALKPTLIVGIFVGYSLTSHEYIVFVYSAGAIVEYIRVYFNSDVFPDDSGGALVSTDKIFMCPADTGSIARLHDYKSPASTKPASTEVTASGLVPSATAQVNGYDTQFQNSITETKLL